MSRRIFPDVNSGPLCPKIVNEKSQIRGQATFRK
jgi:hypothetical protein